MGKLFGTDGVRGVANSELTGQLAFHLGQAGAYVLTKETKKQPKILVARDTRISGTMLESALVAGICSVGAKAICIGVVPTPAVAYLTKELGMDAGVMISASHNPLEFNGIKFFNSEGYKLRDELEDEIENLVYGGQIRQEESLIVSNARHLQLLRDASAALGDAMKMTEMEEALDFIEVDVKRAYDLLGEITGDSVADDIINEVFKRFCLGK